MNMVNDFPNRKSDDLDNIIDTKDTDFNNYLTWEETRARPRLKQKGYGNIIFTDGERDSFGPLSRVALCEKNGELYALVYG